MLYYCDVLTATLPSFTTTSSMSTTTTTTTTTTAAPAAPAAPYIGDTTVNLDVTVIPLTMLPASCKFFLYFVYGQILIFCILIFKQTCLVLLASDCR